MNFSIVASLLSFWFLIHPGTLQAEVFYAKDEALHLAYPEADHFEMQTLIINSEQSAKIEELAKVKLDSKIFTFHKAFHGKVLLGYVAIDSHIVRTHPETFMLVLSPEGMLEKVVILAFHEPPEYMASERWLNQFAKKNLADRLYPSGDIQGIAGSTLTSQAMSAGVRKILAIYQVLIAAR